MAPMTLSRQRHALLVQCLADRAEPVAKSPRFTIYHLNPDPADAAGDLDDIIVVHDFAPAEIDNNIARHVADELLPLLVADAPRPVARDGYGATDQEVFERFVGEIVRSVDGNERRAWHLFYDNTLAALDRAGREAGAAKGVRLTRFTGSATGLHRRLCRDLPAGDRSCGGNQTREHSRRGDVLRFLPAASGFGRLARDG
jgi:hypothetical protein